MLEAYNASNNSATSYIYEPGVDRPLAQVLSNGSVRYVHQDVLGSVVMLTDSNGAAYQSYSYDAWGKVTARDASGSVIASSAISAPWLFTGRRFDKESGLYHYRARTYSAELGRFLQMDPIKFDAGDPNIFRYVGNDPINGNDPWGMWQVTFSAGAGIGATITFGYNSGQANFGSYVGFGSGLSGKYDSSDSGCHQEGAFPELRASASIPLKYGISIPFSETYNNADGFRLSSGFNSSGGSSLRVGFTSGGQPTVGFSRGASVFAGAGVLTGLGKLDHMRVSL